MSPRAQDLQTLRNADLLGAARIQANAMMWWPIERSVYGMQLCCAPPGYQTKMAAVTIRAPKQSTHRQAALW